MEIALPWQASLAARPQLVSSFHIGHVVAANADSLPTREQNQAVHQRRHWAVSSAITSLYENASAPPGAAWPHVLDVWARIQANLNRSPDSSTPIGNTQCAGLINPINPLPRQVHQGFRGLPGRQILRLEPPTCLPEGMSRLWTDIAFSSVPVLSFSRAAFVGFRADCRYPPAPRPSPSPTPGRPNVYPHRIGNRAETPPHRPVVYARDPELHT